MARKVLYTVTLLGLLLPFLFITDFYPFFRLGMFAETAKQSGPQEKFVLLMLTKKNWQALPADSFKLSESTFHDLARNHIHRGECEKMLEKISALLPQASELKLIRIQPSSDTNLVATWRKR
ncbi:MAG: hypothetical protein MUF42_14450 [Cytophagaceae bacterium]|jgi:hypothetical protein|nr:hypothetical protein [Cytophagaceae bacterium]